MPNILSVSPTNLQTDVILGASIVVTFDSLMDPTTINNSTVSLTGPAQTQVLTPQQLISSDPSYITGRNSIPGSIVLTTNSSNQTVLTFTPISSLIPNASYTVLLVGSGSILVGSSIKDTSGKPLSTNYMWTFNTGTLNTTLPPLQAPLPYQYAAIDPNKIKVIVNGHNPGDLLNQQINSTYTIQFIFPAPVDTTSFLPTDILLSIEQFLGDPTVPIPSGLTPTITTVGNTITVTLTAS